VERAETEQRLEGGEGASAVVPENELIEVDLQVLRRDAVGVPWSQVFRFESARCDGANG